VTRLLLIPLLLAGAVVGLSPRPPADGPTRGGRFLLARQSAGGSWANPVELVRADAPVLATAYAVSALAGCR
jgi:hypothetical protein